jgi:hypothetical protein
MLPWSELLIASLYMISSGNIKYAQKAFRAYDRPQSSHRHRSRQNLSYQKTKAGFDREKDFKNRRSFFLKVQVSIFNVTYDMVKGDDGVWRSISKPQDFGFHNYRMIVRGVIIMHPAG